MYFFCSKFEAIIETFRISPWYFILDGNSEIGVHLLSNPDYLSYLMYFFLEGAVTKLIFFSTEKSSEFWVTI